MKTKQLYYAILICTGLFLLNLTGCGQQYCHSKDLHHSFQCSEPNELIKVWPMIDKKNIRRIMLLYEDKPIEVPQECLEGYIELLDNAIRKFKIKDTMNIEQSHQIKVITNKKEYLLPGEWMIYGNRTDSTTYRALQNYFNGCDVWEPRCITYDANGWTKLHSPRKEWSEIKKENIGRIIFCRAGGDYGTEWIVAFEVPQNCLKGTIGLLDKAMHEQKMVYNMFDAWMGFSGMKIITDKGKYLVPAEWPGSKYSRNKKINGSDWASDELWKYLKTCGWADPNN